MFSNMTRRRAIGKDQSVIKKLSFHVRRAFVKDA